MLEFGKDSIAKDLELETEIEIDYVPIGDETNLKIEDIEPTSLEYDWEMDLGEIDLGNDGEGELIELEPYDDKDGIILNDLNLGDLDELLKTHVSLPEVTKDYFKGKYSVDMIGLNPTTLIKEEDMELIGILLNLVPRKRVQAFIYEMTVFRNHIVRLISEDTSMQAEEFLSIYSKFDSKVRDLEAINKRFRYLGVSTDFSDKMLRTLYEKATNGNKLKDDEIYFVYKSIEMATRNPFKDLVNPGGDLNKRAIDYINRKYEYTEEEIEMLSRLDFPEIYGNEAWVKEKSHIEHKMNTTKLVDKDTQELAVSEVIKKSNIIPKFHNAYLSMKRGYAEMKYNLDTIIP